MSPFPLVAPPRIGAATLPLAMEVRLARRGGRAFAPRDQPGDVTIALPEVGGPATVLVPRGFGHPLFGRRVGGELRAEPAGEPCAPARWVPAGGVAAWLRAVPPPRGPTHAVRAEPVGEATGAWMCVRPAALAWSALRLVSPAAGHGPVAVADRWVRAVSPGARARGVTRGMSLALARRRCPELIAYAPSGGLDLGAEVARRLAAWFGGVTRRPGVLLVRLSGAAMPGPEALPAAERIARLLWQELGVEARIAVGATPEAARGLAALLEPGWVAVAAPMATSAWAGRAARAARCDAGSHRASWQGAPAPDLEGAVARATMLSGGLVRAARGGVLRLRLQGARGQADARVRVPSGCGRLGLARLVEALVRREGAAVGAIESMSLVCAAHEGAGAKAIAAPPARGAAASSAPSPRSEPARVRSPRRAGVGVAAPAASPPTIAVPPRPAQLALLPRVR
ncbi:MAG: hypothetical protein Q8P41_06130 [Pseudomonadota bacterium]|nr:hypothetical protein [Pseudomonadota bacterium]